MFEQDYIMRLIKDMVRAILKLLFGIDTPQPTAELLEVKEDRAVLESLMDLVDAGKICEAENRIYELTDSEKKTDLEIALLFYSYLNDKDNAFLEEHDFRREEVKTGLQDILEKYGIMGLTDAFVDIF